jgi:hypothetical protein
LREHLPFPLPYRLIEERLPAVKQAKIAVRRFTKIFSGFFRGFFHRIGAKIASGDLVQKQGTVRGEKGGMMGKKVLGLMAVLMLLLILATPLTAADKTIQLSIPGCAV